MREVDAERANRFVGRIGAAAATWRERALGWRDRWLADRAFQRWAASFPITRGVANRSARRLFDLAAGFVYSQVLLACVELGVFELLAGGARTREAVARETGLAPERAERLLKAAVALGLLERRGEAYRLGLLGAALRGAPGLVEMILHHRMLYADLARPVALLRGESETRELARFWAYAGETCGRDTSSEAVAGYSALMGSSQAMIAEDIVDAAPLAGRVRVVGGDFRADSLPPGADVVTLVRVLHDHDDAAALDLLRAIRAALPAGGLLVIAEPMSGVRGAEAAADAYFGFYLLAMGQGRARSPAEIGALGARAGFHAPRSMPTRRPLLTSVLMLVAADRA